MIGAVVCFAEGSAIIRISSVIFFAFSPPKVFARDKHCAAISVSSPLRDAIIIFPVTSSARARKIAFCKNEIPPFIERNCFGKSGRDAGQSLSPNPPARITTSVNIKTPGNTKNLYVPYYIDKNMEFQFAALNESA